MKKLITLLPLLAIFSSSSIAIVSCDNYQNARGTPSLLTDVSKKQHENKVNNAKNDYLNNDKTNKKAGQNSSSNQASSKKGDNNNVSNIQTNNIAKEKSWEEKLNEEDPQYLNLIHFIEMIGNSIKQFLVNNKYKLLKNYQQLTQVKFWDYFWNFFKVEFLNVKTTNKKLHNEIFEDAILQNSNLLSNECIYVLKSNNFISFTIGYDKTNLNFYFVSTHPKYGRIDSKTTDNVFKKKYEPIYCTIVLQDGVVPF